MSTDFYRALFDRSSDAHFILDETGILDCNQAAVEMVGCSRKEEVLHLHPSTLSPERQPNGELSSKLSRENQAVTHEKGWNRFEWYHRKVTGEIFLVEVTLNSIEIEGRRMILGVWHDLTDRKRKEDELELLNAELSVANQRMRDNLEAASKVQRALLPRTGASFPHLKSAWAYSPSETLGGDQFNVFNLTEEALGFYCLDVTGHGVAASLLAVSISYFISNLAENLSLDPSPKRIVSPKNVIDQLNRHFQWKAGEPQFFTIICGIIYPREKRVRYSCAGCPGPIYLAAGKEPQFLDVPGFAVGMLANATYEEQDLTLSPGDRFFIYSDGVPEAANPSGAFFDKEGIRRVLLASRDCLLEEQVETTLEAVRQWCAPAPPRDDISLLAFEVT